MFLNASNTPYNMIFFLLNMLLFLTLDFYIKPYSNIYKMKKTFSSNWSILKL